MHQRTRRIDAGWLGTTRSGTGEPQSGAQAKDQRVKARDRAPQRVRKNAHAGGRERERGEKKKKKPQRNSHPREREKEKTGEKPRGKKSPKREKKGENPRGKKAPKKREKKGKNPGEKKAPKERNQKKRGKTSGAKKKPQECAKRRMLKARRGRDYGTASHQKDSQSRILDEFFYQNLETNQDKLTRTGERKIQ